MVNVEGDSIGAACVAHLSREELSVEDCECASGKTNQVMPQIRKQSSENGVVNHGFDDKTKMDDYLNSDNGYITAENGESSNTSL